MEWEHFRGETRTSEEGWQPAAVSPHRHEEGPRGAETQASEDEDAVCPVGAGAEVCDQTGSGSVKRSWKLKPITLDGVRGPGGTAGELRRSK